jgi:hypothetical protein
MDKERIAAIPFEIDQDVSDTPPARQINAQQNGTAYIWNSTTQELLPILWPDHPQ